MSIIKGLSDFMKNQLLPASKYVDTDRYDRYAGIFGDSRRKTKIRRGLTTGELNLLRKIEVPLTKEQQLKHVQRQIDDTLKLILYHEQCMQSCGDDLARLIQKQKNWKQLGNYSLTALQ